MENNKKELTLNEYQKQAMTTCMPTSENFSYMFLNLVGEVGEFASKIAKQIRKNNFSIIANNINIVNGININNSNLNYENSLIELQKEAGDILWQLSGLCTVIGWNLDDVAQMNLDKLASRKDRNVIDGNGDNR